MSIETMASEAVFQTTADYDSGWQEANNHSSYEVSFDHGLGVVPSQVSIMFTSDKETVYPLMWSWEKGDSGNPVTVSMTDNVVKLQISDNSPLHGAWKAREGWTRWSQGYFRAFAWK